MGRLYKWTFIRQYRRKRQIFTRPIIEYSEMLKESVEMAFQKIAKYYPIEYKRMTVGHIMMYPRKYWTIKGVNATTGKNIRSFLIKLGVVRM